MSGFAPRFTISDRITDGLTRIERARGFLEAAALSQQWVLEMERRALVREAHHTTHIEGTRLTLEQAERLLAGSPVPEADPDDARELLNYREAFDFVSSYLQDGGPVTEGLIREIHWRTSVSEANRPSGEQRLRPHAALRPPQGAMTRYDNKL